jgi:hypothetical protein
VVASHIPHFVVYTLNAIKFLILSRPLGGIRPIIVGEVLYRLINTFDVYNFVMCFFFICRFISLVWQLRLITIHGIQIALYV